MNSISINQAAALLRGKATGNRISCPGPGHKPGDRSLSVTFTNDGRLLVNTFSPRNDWQECRDYVKRVLGIEDREQQPVTYQPHTVMSSGSDRARLGAVLRLWDSSIPINGTLAETYLASRGLTYDGDALRFRPACRSLVALITNVITGEPCGAQRTSLNPDGSAVRMPDGRKKKLNFGSAAGTVRLYDHEPGVGLSIAEGVETALASGVRPLWACLSSSIMQGLPVLPGVQTLTVFADHDVAGIAAANAVGERWHEAGREVILTMPAEPGKDFADMLEAA